MSSGHEPASALSYLIASLYTASHRPLAERLAASLTRFGLPYALYEVPTVHRSLSVRGTDDPAYTKASFVRLPARYCVGCPFCIWTATA
jgi:hypothetical protein